HHTNFFALIYLPCYFHHRDLHSFPTRRSSDLGATPSFISAFSQESISPYVFAFHSCAIFGIWFSSCSRAAVQKGEYLHSRPSPWRYPDGSVPVILRV